ncbi:VP91 [Buzura suppressaria nucleopolyhedrovirus]|uniref:VP91 n=1 Tax=Buzura suppressaria nuclear polyhedrosis virus TaxID=74320 RepID=W5VKG9_NPVBS|nr:VP91 [Buzura suppressaria nucleopolyhedrovirus]AHH82655.1 VP91 [Buzura suppressaria nucleopolyhedrovirus]QYF10558.1 virion capsid protein-91 [Buzura suppressaria nucleopolyhedrovirus]
MLTVPLLLAVIFLSIIFFILYLIIYNDFNENELNNRLQITIEFMRRTNAEQPLPDRLSYVSDVDSHIFTVTTFDTNTLNVINVTHHDDRIELFNFLMQTFENVSIETLNDPRIRPHSNDRNRFQVRGDDGWFDVECSYGKRFDPLSEQCVSIDVCEDKPPGNYGLTERMIDTLVLNHNVVKQNTNDQSVHPSMYLRCLADGTHKVEECPPNHLFDDVEKKCVLHNDCETKPNGFVLPVIWPGLNANEYLMCENGAAKVVQCPNDKIFDRQLMMCVDSHPCAIHGFGHTYISNEIGDTQFFKCVNNIESELITCINRVFNAEGQYECSGDAMCAVFENGTGESIYIYEDNNVKFNTGILVCDNYEKSKEINCNTSNIFENRVYNDKLKINVHLPFEIYNKETDNCEFNHTLIEFKTPYFAVETIPNDLNVDYETTMIGDTKRIFELIETDQVDGVVRYARDSGHIGLNPLDGTPIDCYGGISLYDVFDARQINMCGSQGTALMQIQLNDNQFIISNGTQLGVDADYHSACTTALAKFTDYVQHDHFTVQILNNILHSDVCGTILNQIHTKYTTLSISYTTIDDKYNYESVKVPFYMDQNHANTYDLPITIEPIKVFEMSNKNGQTLLKKDKMLIKNDDGELTPLFDLFERVETIEPAFDPFNHDQLVDTRDHDRTPSPPPPPIGPPVLPPSLPELNLTQNLIEFSCFYALPTFKMNACEITDDHIEQTLKLLRQNVIVHPDCATAAGLANVINAYAYLGDGVGCRSVYDPVDGIMVNRVNDGQVFLNLDTQSNDGIKYNTCIHKKDNYFTACPLSVFDENNFDCNIPSNKLYYLENLQF